MSTNLLETGKVTAARLIASPTVRRLAIGGVFVWWMTGYWWAKALGEDFPSLYFGARLYGTPALYASELTDFPAGDDPTWKHVIDESNFPGGRWHPYVHIPLLARILSPLFSHMDYDTALRGMIAINAVCLVIIVWAAANLLCRRLLQPLAFGVSLLVFATTAPVVSAMTFAQTTPVIIAATLVALNLAVRRPLLAGLLLAIVSAIKISPIALVVVLFFLPKYRKAALYAVLSGIVIGALNLWVSGVSLTKEWIEAAQRASDSAMFVNVNQSPTKALISLLHTDTTVGLGAPVITPIWVKVVVAAIVLSATAYALFVGRRLDGRARASLAIIWALCFIPLAAVPLVWQHYHVVMILVVMAFIGLALAADPGRRRNLLFAAAAVTTLMETAPWANAPLLPSVSDSELTVGGSMVAVFSFVALTAAYATDPTVRQRNSYASADLNAA